MENRENLSGNENRQNIPRTKNYEINKTNRDVDYEKNLSADTDPGSDSEIDLAGLDQTEVSLDRDGVDNSQGTEVNEFGKGDSNNNSGKSQSGNGKVGNPTAKNDAGTGQQPRAGLNSQGSTQNAGVSGKKTK